MTGILVALLVIVLAALCFILGMLFGAWLVTADLHSPSKAMRYGIDNKEENK